MIESSKSLKFSNQSHGSVFYRHQSSEVLDKYAIAFSLLDFGAGGDRFEITATLQQL
ncbi:hypothetical protein H6F78_16565 [Coleofasciculus sp. FACHB-64]|uniref:hypothetical protein n=1 Tax=Cyanophyceae TaxID=3028117 RepID=UPI001687E56E|nr:MULTISPECIES: hypothetical protein [unclassified Coleofasciculus]MBD1840840.1 hypothetical protein [Coleofasciculus sp. FACHB-501]MBD2047188.1 hypothetical protein [Coleofasciculus sp. FACHB-64]